jgi:histidinol-phosphatase (PHP family)
MERSRLDAYLHEIRQQKMRLSETLELYAGLEIDFVSGKIGPADFASELDYTIGSIHIAGQLADQTPWEVDMSTELFKRGVTELFGGSFPRAVTHYYTATMEMLTTSTPTILGHLDKIKIHNKENVLFDEGSSWYRDAVIGTLEITAKKDVILEVNTRGLYQKKTTDTYPAAWVLQAAFERNIPIVLSSDAHAVADIHQHFPATAQFLRGLGYRELMTLREGIWIPMPFSEKGVEWK